MFVLACDILSANASGTIILLTSNLSLDEAVLVEGNYTLMVNGFEFAEGSTDKHKRLDVTMWYQNLSFENVELDKISTAKVVFREKYEVSV